MGLNASLPVSPVYVAAVADLHDLDDEHIVSYGVNDPVLALPDPICLLP